MTMRRMLLGMVASVAVCGMAMAKPPGGALSEGRELDPVARDFYLAEQPVAPVESSVPARGEKPGDVYGWSMLASLHDAIMDHFTMPLGTVPDTDIR